MNHFKHITILIILLFSLKSEGQLLDNNMCAPDYRLKTNAKSPFPSNQGYKTNIYDWTIIRNGAGNTPNYFYKVLTPPIGYNTDELDNPYYTNNTGNFLAHMCKMQMSDFYPEDGWELIKRSTGFATASPNTAPVNDPDIQTINNRIPAIPVDYFILYNRYTGILRVWGRVKQPVPNFNFVDINLRFIYPKSQLINGVEKNPYFSFDQNYHIDHKVSALFNTYNRVQNTLDMETDITHVSATTINSGVDNANWFFAEFLMGYDPCNCQNFSDIKISFDFIQSSDITMEGYGYITNEKTALKNLSQSLLSGFSNGNLNAFVSNNVILNHNFNQPSSSFSQYQTTQGMLSMKGDLAMQAWLNKVKGDIDNASMRKKDKDEMKELYSSAGNLLSMGLLKPFFKGASFLSNILVKGGDNYMLLGSRMMMNGVSTLKIDGENSLRFDVLANPGSLESNLRSENQALANNSTLFNGKIWGGYPTYNQTLGVIALKKRPEVDVYHNVSSEIDVPFTKFAGENTSDLDWVKYQERKIQVKMRNVPIEYIINPATNYDAEKTKVTAALRIKFIRRNQITNNEKILLDGNDNCEMPSGASIDREAIDYKVKNGTLIGSPKYLPRKTPIGVANTSWTDTMEYITPFVDHNCLNKVLFSVYDKFNSSTAASYGLAMFSGRYGNGTGNLSSFYNSVGNKTISVELVLSLDLVSKDIGKNGKPNESSLTFSFPVDIKPITQEYNENEYQNLPPKVLTIGNLVKTQGGITTIVATEKIIVNGPIEDYSPGRIQLISKEIEVINAGVIGRNVDIIPSDYINWDGICESKLINNASISCTNPFEYKANNPFFKSTNAVFEDISELEKSLAFSTSLSLHPNPASSIAKLTLTNFQNTSANIKIFDLMGREMLEVIEKDITSREHSVDLDIERLAPGTYVVKVNNGLDEKTTKLVVVRY